MCLPARVCLIAVLDNDVVLNHVPKRFPDWRPALAPAGCAAGGGCGIPAPCSADGQITATGKRALWREGGLELAGGDLWYLVG